MKDARWLLPALAAFCAVSHAVAAAAQTGVPSPPPRPAERPAPVPLPMGQPDADDNDELRAQVLASGRLIGEALPPIDDKGGCIIAAPLRLDAILLKGGEKVALVPAVIVRASLASAVADWVREDLARAIAKGDRLTGIEGAGGYECRGRNRIAGAKLSEHAIGNALDLDAFQTEHGERFAVAAPDPSSTAFLARVKDTACQRFSTVLGPGSDAFHEQHLHVDLEARRHGGHLCEWTLPGKTTSTKP